MQPNFIHAARETQQIYVCMLDLYPKEDSSLYKPKYAHRESPIYVLYTKLAALKIVLLYMFLFLTAIPSYREGNRCIDRQTDLEDFGRKQAKIRQKKSSV